MKRKMIGIAVSLIGVLVMTAPAQNPGQAKAEVALRAAMETETVKGDLKAAIEQYKKLAQGSDRAIAAQALIHMGECYEKLGSKEARTQYDLVISKFADQKYAVAQARSHLGGATARTSGMVSRPVWEPAASVDIRALSPDGRYISFDDWSDNGGTLALHDLTTGTDRRLTKATKDEYPDESAFSPDGKQIAYIWQTKQGSDLRVLSLSGTAPAVPRVFKNAEWEYDTVAWSPDGKWLAAYAGPKGEPGQVVLVSVQDGSFRPLAPAANSNLFFSPDGKYLAYDRSTNGRGSQTDIFVLAIDSGREIPAVVYPSRDSAMGWSPDGHLLFASDRNGSMGLWALPFKDGKPQGPPTQIKADIGSGDSVGLASSGALYYQVRSGGQSAYLETAPFDFAAGRILSSPITVGTAQGAFDWSPDGKYLAYVKPSSANGHQGPLVTILSTETGQNRDLRSDCLFWPSAVRWAPDSHNLASAGIGNLCQFDTQTERGAISKFTGEDPQGTPAWSPDQKKLYFRLATPGGGDSVAFIERDLASGNQREIIRRPSLGGLNLTPDGRYIVTHADPPNASVVVVIPVAGGEPKELIRRPAMGGVAISPDGKYVALVNSPANKPAQALLIPVAGGEPRELLSATPPLVMSTAMWAPDSRSVFLKKSTKDNEQTELWRVPVDGAPPVKLDMNANLDHIQGGFRVSPDGRQIAFLRGERTPGKNETWVLENFLSSIPASK